MKLLDRIIYTLFPEPIDLTFMHVPAKVKGKNMCKYYDIMRDIDNEMYKSALDEYSFMYYVLSDDLSDKDISYIMHILVINGYECTLMELTDSDNKENHPLLRIKWNFDIISLSPCRRRKKVRELLTINPNAGLIA
jgi:hypothetical protein